MTHTQRGLAALSYHWRSGRPSRRPQFPHASLTRLGPHTRSWTVADVGQWLHTLELGDHAAEFSAASVDGLTLQTLKEKDCQELGVTPRLRALKLLARRDALVAQLAEAAAGGAVRVIQPDEPSAGALPAALPSPEVAYAKAEAAEAKLQAETLRSELETVRSLQMRLLEELEALRSGSPAKPAAAPKPEADAQAQAQAEKPAAGEDTSHLVNMEEEAREARLAAAAKAVEEEEAAASAAKKAEEETPAESVVAVAEPAAVVAEAPEQGETETEAATSAAGADVDSVEGGAVTEKEQEALVDVSLLPDVASPPEAAAVAVQLPPPPPEADAAPAAAPVELPPPPQSPPQASPPADEVTAAVQQHAAATNSGSPASSGTQHLRALAAASGAQPGSPAALRSLAAAAVAIDEAREEMPPRPMSTASAVAAHAAAAAASPLAARARELTSAAEAALAKALQDPSKAKDVAALQTALASARSSSGVPGSPSPTASLAMLLSDTTGGLGPVPELLPAAPQPVPTAAAKVVPPPLPLDATLRIVSGAGDGSVRVTRVVDTVKERSLDGHRDAVRCVAILPGSPPRLVSGSVDRQLRVWRWADGACEAVLKGHVDTVRAVAPMGPTSCVSASDDKTLRIWEGLGGSGKGSPPPVCAQVLQGHTAAVWAVCVISGPPCRVVSGSWDHTLRVWDPTTGTCVRTLAGHSDTVNALVTLPGNRVASGGGDRCIRVWAPLHGEDGAQEDQAGSGQPGIAPAGAAPLCERVCWGHTSTVYALAALPDGRIVSGSGDGTLRLWGASGTSCERVMKSGSGSVSGTVCALDTLGAGRVVSGSTDRMVSIWNLVDGTCERILGGHASSVWAVASLKL